MKPTSCKELKHLAGQEGVNEAREVEMKPTSCKELKLNNINSRGVIGNSVEMKPTSCKELKQQALARFTVGAPARRNETYFL